MKFKDLREQVKGGKLDPLSKMGKSKLTGQEMLYDILSQKPEEKFYSFKKQPNGQDHMYELALDLGGNQTLAVKEIEKMKKGLSK